MTNATLVFMFKGDQILLAMKKRGMGEGKWNGPGGKLKTGEDPIEAAVPLAERSLMDRWLLSSLERLVIEEEVLA